MCLFVVSLIAHRENIGPDDAAAIRRLGGHSAFFLVVTILPLPQYCLLAVLRIQCAHRILVVSVTPLPSCTSGRRKLDIGFRVSAAVGTVFVITLPLGRTAVEETRAKDHFDEGLHYWNAGGDSHSTAFDSGTVVVSAGRCNQGIQVSTYMVHITRSDVSYEKSGLAKAGSRVVL